MQRYHLAVPVDIWMGDRRESEPCRGSLSNLSGVGVGLTLGQSLKTNQKVTPTELGGRHVADAEEWRWL